MDVATCNCGTNRPGESSDDGIRLSKGGKILTTACKICAKPIETTCACRPLGGKKKSRQKKSIDTGVQLRWGAPVQHQLIGRLYRGWGQRRTAAEQHQSSQDRRRTPRPERPLVKDGEAVPGDKLSQTRLPECIQTVTSGSRQVRR